MVCLELLLFLILTLDCYLPRLFQCRINSSTPSMMNAGNDDPYAWHRPEYHDPPGFVSSPLSDSHEDAADDSKMSSHLLDSCL